MLRARRPSALFAFLLLFAAAAAAAPSAPSAPAGAPVRGRPLLAHPAVPSLPVSAPPHPQQRVEETNQMLLDGRVNLHHVRPRALGAPRFLFQRDGSLNPAIKRKPDPFALAPPLWQALNGWRRPARAGAAPTP